MARVYGRERGDAVPLYTPRMANFAFVARDSQGRQVTGTLEGPAAAAVVSELQSRGLAPIRVSETASAPPTGRSVPAARLAAMYRQLADLLRAGVPLLRAIRLLARGKSHRGLSEAMAAVADAVAQGDRLADAMSRFPRTFPSVQVAMIRAGERGGFLEPVLGRLGAFLERQAQMKGKVLGNLIYPAVLLLVGVGLVVAALVFFVPRFADLFATMDLPLATRILLGLSAWLTTWYPAIPFLLVGLVAGWSWARRRPEVRVRLARWQLSTPGIGTIVGSLAVARFCRTLGTLLENGIPLLAAMQISRDAAGNDLLAAAIDEATEAVRSGEPLAAPLGRSGLFAEETVEMISVGESANNLAEVLVGIADSAERRIDSTLTILVRLMEPALLLVLAGMVLFIFLALVVPMMQMGSQL